MIAAELLHSSHDASDSAALKHAGRSYPLFCVNGSRFHEYMQTIQLPSVFATTVRRTVRFDANERCYFLMTWIFFCWLRVAISTLLGDEQRALLLLDGALQVVLSPCVVVDLSLLRRCSHLFGL
jgi:hypothetical protein